MTIKKVEFPVPPKLGAMSWQMTPGQAKELLKSITVTEEQCEKAFQQIIDAHYNFISGYSDYLEEDEVRIVLPYKFIYLLRAYEHITKARHGRYLWQKFRDIDVYYADIESPMIVVVPDAVCSRIAAEGL